MNQTFNKMNGIVDSSNMNEIVDSSNIVKQTLTKNGGFFSNFSVGQSLENLKKMAHPIGVKVSDFVEKSLTNKFVEISIDKVSSFKFEEMNFLMGVITSLVVLVIFKKIFSQKKKGNNVPVDQEPVSTPLPNLGFGDPVPVTVNVPFGFNRPRVKKTRKKSLDVLKNKDKLPSAYQKELVKWKKDQSFKIAEEIKSNREAFKIWKDVQPKKRQKKSHIWAEVDIQIKDHTEKAYCVTGSTKDIKDALKNSKEDYNFSAGWNSKNQGWMVSKKQHKKLEKLLTDNGKTFEYVYSN